MEGVGIAVFPVEDVETSLTVAKDTVKLSTLDCAVDCLTDKYELEGSADETPFTSMEVDAIVLTSDVNANTFSTLVCAVDGSTEL